MAIALVKPLALVDNRTGHLMLLVDARTLAGEIEGGATCQLRQEDGRFVLDLSSRPGAMSIGPFSRSEADKLRHSARLTVAVFRDGIVTRAREVTLRTAALETAL